MKKVLIYLLCSILISVPALAETVIYNPNSGIYHKTTCYHGKRCKSAIKIDKKQAIKKGGRPCKTCGG